MSAEALIEKYRTEALEKAQAEQEAQSRNRENLKKRIAQLAILRKAKENYDAKNQSEANDLKKKESDDLARALQSEDLKPAKIYQIMSERHMAEMKNLEDNFLREKEIEKRVRENEIRIDRENLKKDISDPNELEKFDRETERLILAANDAKKDQLELFEQKNKLKMKQMKEIEDILVQFDPEVAMRLQAEKDARNLEALEEESRRAAMEVFQRDIDAKKAEKRQKIQELEKKQKESEKILDEELKKASEKDMKRLAKREEIENRKVENEMKEKVIIFYFFNIKI